MRLFDRTPVLRWMVPVVAGVLLIGGGATVTAITASADPAGLTPRSAAQLLVDVQQAQLGSLSGTIVQRADLGIPELPGAGKMSSSDLTSLISGTHTLRVWYDGADKARMALLGTLGESDVIKNGSDLWIWSSNDNTASHRTLAASTPETAKGATGLPPTALPSTPQDAAAAVLAALDPSTVVTTDAAQTVAGRPVYQLMLKPKDTRSLIGRITIAIDAVEHIPLRVQVFAAGAQPNPAFEVAFSSVDFSAPDPAEFNFNPPPGAQVTTEAQPTQVDPAGGGGRPDKVLVSPGPRATLARPDNAAGSGGQPDNLSVPAVQSRIVGTGWTSVLVAGSPTGSAASTGSGSGTSALTGQLAGIVRALPAVSGKWGTGHLLTGTIFSVVLTDDGRIAVGAVQPDLLYAALG